MRYWNDVPPEQRATAENDMAWRIARGDGTGYPFNRGENTVRYFFNEHRKRYLRILSIPDRCEAAVQWYSSHLWGPCRNKARGHGLCWIHGGWRKSMPKQVINVDCDEAEPQAEVTLRLTTIRLDTMTRQLGKLKRAAENMGAPADATVHLDSYGDHTLARVRWQA